MVEQRKDTRFQSPAKVKIEGVCEGETLLKDISVTGCRVECTTYAEIEPNTQYKIEIIPENAAKIGVFDFLAESKWVRLGGYYCEVGFSIIDFPKEKQFERYVDYLSWRYSQGNSMTKSNILDPPSLK